MNIPDVHDFDAARACKELLKRGFTVVDDIGELLYKNAEEELFEELGHRGDYLDIVTDRVDTDMGPVFVFRDSQRVAPAPIASMLQEARKAGRGNP